jgi:hypothetical protein
MQREILPHRGVADRGDLTQVHPGDRLAADQVATVGTGDRERIAPQPIASNEVALEIHAPELVRRGDIGERLRVGSRPSLPALRACQTCSPQDVAECTGRWPDYFGLQHLKLRPELPRAQEGYLPRNARIAFSVDSDVA